MPACVGFSTACSRASSFASPKSRIFTRPSFVRKTFSGFRSRWTIPFSCAAAEAGAIWTAMSTAIRSESGPARRRSRQRLPFEELLDEEMPPRGFLEGEERGDARMVQRREQRSPPARSGPSCARPRSNSSGRTLSATSRPTRTSFALQTSPIPARAEQARRSRTDRAETPDGWPIEESSLILPIRHGLIRAGLLARRPKQPRASGRA